MGAAVMTGVFFFPPCVNYRARGCTLTSLHSCMLLRKSRAADSHEMRAAHALYAGSLARARWLVIHPAAGAHIPAPLQSGSSHSGAPGPGEEEDEQRCGRCRTPLKLFPENRSVAPRRPWDAVRCRRTSARKLDGCGRWEALLCCQTEIVLMFSLHSRGTAGASVDVILVQLVSHCWRDVTFLSLAV